MCVVLFVFKCLWILLEWLIFGIIFSLKYKFLKLVEVLCFGVYVINLIKLLEILNYFLKSFKLGVWIYFFGCVFLKILEINGFFKWILLIIGFVWVILLIIFNVFLIFLCDCVIVVGK